VAIWGNTIVVGASGYQNNVGLVYIYNRLDNGNWVLSTSLNSVGGRNKQFGYSLAIYNQTIVVGAPGLMDGKSGNYSGAVYSFQYNAGSHQWTLNQTLDSPAGANSYFGVAVKVSNYRLAIGADGFRKFFFFFLNFSFIYFLLFFSSW
jgi:hypothetical protein